MSVKSFEVGKWYVQDDFIGMIKPKQFTGESGDDLIFRTVDYDIAISKSTLPELLRIMIEVQENGRLIGNNPINHPSHYNTGTVEVIDQMVTLFGKEKVKVFCEINAFKYRMRAGHKGDSKEDIDKALWYENKMKEL